MAANLVAPAAAQRFVDPRTGIITVPWQQFLANLTTAASGSGVTSFNTRIGAVTLNGTDVSTALGYTPYDSANPAGYITAAGAPVQSVAGKTGVVTLAVADVSGAAPLASPTFTGTPAAPTAAPGTNTTQLATTAFVEAAIGAGNFANVKAFGAVGNGATDDTTAIQNAINSGLPVYFPPGTYRITAALTATNVDLMLFGGGPGASIVKVDGAINGITFAGTRSTGTLNHLVISNISIQANTNTALNAVQATWTGTGSVNLRTTYIDNVEISSFNGAASSFGRGLYLIGADSAAISASYISTYDWFTSGGIRSGSVGIEIISTAATPAFEFDLSGIYICQCDTGIKYNADASATNNNCQGLFVDRCHLVNNTFGIKAGNSAAVPGGTTIEPEVVITNCFVDSQVLGIDIQAQAQILVSGCLHYGRNANWIGIQFTSVNAGGYQVDGRVLGNTFIPLGGGTTVGVKVIGNAGAHESILIDANTFEALTNSAAFDANTDSAIYTYTNTVISGGAASDLGTGNIVDGKGQTTPVPTAGSGAFTTVSSVVDYEKIGRFAKCRVTITDTNNGTAASFINLVMPFTATSESVFYGRCAAVSGKTVNGIMPAGSSTLTVTLYDNTYPGATGERITLEGMIFV